jgi:hypothetical protein
VNSPVRPRCLHSVMCFCRPGIRTKIIYHDGRDWIVERRGEEYWSFALDEEQWQRGLPSGMTSDDIGFPEIPEGQ